MCKDSEDMEIKYEVADTDRDKETSDTRDNKGEKEGKEHANPEHGTEHSESSASLDPARELLRSETNVADEHAIEESRAESDRATDSRDSRSTEHSNTIDGGENGPEASDSVAAGQVEASPQERSMEMSNDRPSDLSGQIESSGNLVQIGDEVWALPDSQAGPLAGIDGMGSTKEFREEIGSNHDDLRFFEDVRNGEIGYETYRTGALESNGANPLLDSLNAILGSQEADRQRDELAQRYDALKDGAHPYTEKYPAEQEEEDAEKK